MPPAFSTPSGTVQITCSASHVRAAAEPAAEEEEEEEGEEEEEEGEGDDEMVCSLVS